MGASLNANAVLGLSHLLSNTLAVQESNTEAVRIDGLSYSTSDDFTHNDRKFTYRALRYNGLEIDGTT